MSGPVSYDRKGAAAGPSGWTYEHMKTATHTPVPAAIGAALELIHTFLAGGLPHLPELLDCDLTGLENLVGLAHWLAIRSQTSPMASCPKAGQALARFQLGVDICGGSDIENDILLAHQDALTVAEFYSLLSAPKIMISKSNNSFLGYCDPVNIICYNTNAHFPG